MIKNSKLLVRINNLSEIEEYKKVGISNFLFPLEGYSIGYNSFTLDELKDLNINVYLLVNRVFENKDCDSFRTLKDKLSFASGIFYEDIAVYQILKDTNINLIWNQAHFVTNSHSINVWLDKVYSVCLSNELEHSELDYILSSTTKNVILPILGLNMAMYSRRHLLTYYNEYKGLKDIKKGILRTNNNIEFLAIENNYGTVLFYHKYFNLIDKLSNIDDSKILYYYLDPNELTPKDIIDALNGKHFNEDNRFYENKTIYRIGDIND